MLLQHLHMASDVLPELHQINTQKKGNKRIKPCLEKSYLFMAENTESNHQQKSARLRYRWSPRWKQPSLTPDWDFLFQPFSAVITSASIQLNKFLFSHCKHLTGWLAVMSTNCSELSFPPSPTLLTAAVVFVTVCVKTNMSRSAYEAAPLTPRRRMHATKIQSRNIQRQSGSVLGGHCYSLSPDNEAEFGHDWLWLMHDFTVLLATDLQLITNN